jgi:CRISPR/Cas system CSM-associated protein Csm3 (group 7 of RAMP superfamily)
MFLQEDIAKIKAEIERLESARIGCSDTRILEVIEFRIEELAQNSICCTGTAAA